MLRLTFLLCLLACGLCYGQQTSPMEILFQEQLPLHKQVRVYPEAQKAFNHYRLDHKRFCGGHFWSDFIKSFFGKYFP